MVQGKTIHIYLPTGDPKEVKVANISSELGCLLFSSRKSLDLVQSRKEMSYTGIYFLIGDVNPETGKIIIYIGETESLQNRLNTHIKDPDKDFFSGIILYTTKDNSLNKAMVKYFESFCIDKIKESDKYEIYNKKVSNLANLSESDIADLENYFENLKLLVSTVGHPFFEGEKKISNYHCKNATGEFLDEGFLIKKGSEVSPNTVPSLYVGIVVKRNSLIKDGTIKDNVFQKDYLLSSPSMAASVVLGRPANGWVEWIDDEGRTLDEVKRQGVE